MKEQLSKEEQRKVEKALGHMELQGKFSEALKPFFESYPLYKKFRFKEYGVWNNTSPGILLIQCPSCKAERPFRYSIPLGSGTSTTDRFKTKGLLSNIPRHAIEEFNFYCAACPESIRYWIEINNREKWMWKVGQLPMWLAPIPKDIEKELGEDADLYRKALRNMNESYGIGACAYLRRLLENQINPLLQILYEIKQEEGATQVDLQKITDAIREKNFTKKTESASNIAPQYILIEGFNPFKLLHERLSEALHSLDEETSMKYATEISDTLVYVIRALKKHHREKIEYAEKLKALRGLTTK